MVYDMDATEYILYLVQKRYAGVFGSSNEKHSCQEIKYYIKTKDWKKI